MFSQIPGPEELELRKKKEIYSAEQQNELF